MPVGVGDLAPDFTLPGNGGTSHTLSSYRGKPVVLVFYPADDSPVCTRQLNSYNNELDAFNGVGAQVLAISSQDVAATTSSQPVTVWRFRSSPTPTRQSPRPTAPSAHWDSLGAACSW